MGLNHKPHGIKKTQHYKLLFYLPLLRTQIKMVNGINAIGIIPMNMIFVMYIPVSFTCTFRSGGVGRLTLIGTSSSDIQ